MRLKTSLYEAVYSEQSAYATLLYFEQVQLSPFEHYTQITNTVKGIAFNGNFAVFLCDLEGNELHDITSKVAITQFSDNKAIPQICFEISPIEKDFGKSAIVLKIKHKKTNEVWYSNAFVLTDENKQLTSRFDYKSYTNFDGIAYNRIPSKTQSIRLACAFTGHEIQGNSKEYTTYSGSKIVSRINKTEFEKYIFPHLDNFTYRRLNSLLSHPIIYVNDNRVTDKQILPSSSNYASSNLFSIEFKLSINYEEGLKSKKYADFNNWDFYFKDFNTKK
ncbi:hypothetical protein [Flavobacterium covae]|uniref:hypothetical protein n=1 Tax=Flavobacterium covae TaxID=2906076 RepID=UPI000F4FFD84|nr:hypothetical protein [Flavobacterium covae]